MKRYVLDTNIYFSYIYNGKLNVLVQLILDNNLEVFSNDQMLQELLYNLISKKVFVKANISPKDLMSIITAISKGHNTTMQFFGCPDEHDNFLFALCIEKKCTLVTGDKKLLNWKDSPILIIGKNDFISGLNSGISGKLEY